MRKGAKTGEDEPRPERCPVCKGRWNPKESQREEGSYGYRFKCGYGVFGGELMGGCRHAEKVIKELEQIAWEHGATRWSKQEGDQDGMDRT